MDSTLLDQVRHLCRDRAAYEHLKAILVQQERVHQISWEERYEKLIAAQSSDSQTDIFSNIIAREKAIAQLADAIQRSPSLELVLQIAVQVAQKLLQVDRVAIFRCYPDGRGEFTTDAIASGLTSLADMPERQLSLARHMIESTDPEQSAQTIDSIRTSSLSSHIVTLLEQIGISSYAANKIYAGQDVWGTLVAFHGSVYHSWSESDRTSLSLIAAQIGIAISLTNLRQQSQELTNDLQTLQIELDNLQQTVAELAEKSANSTDDQTINPNNQNVVGEEENNVLNKDLDSGDLEIEVIQLDKDTDVEESELETIISNAEEITNYSDDAISQNGLPPLYLAPDSLSPISSVDERIESDETELFDEPAISFTREDISYVIMPDNLKVISDIASAPDESDQDKSDQDKSDQDKSDQDKSLENSVAENRLRLKVLYLKKAN
jgi:GAF domain-containing protein